MPEISDSWCIGLRGKGKKCMHCEAKSHIRDLEELLQDDPSAFEKMRMAIIFLLENTDWSID